MCLKNKTIIILLIISFIITTISVSQIQADMAPYFPFVLATKEGITICCLTLGFCYVSYNFFKHHKKLPVTSVLFDKEDVYLKINKNEMEVKGTFEYQNTTDEKLKMKLFFPFSKPFTESIKGLSLYSVDLNSSKEKLIEYTVDGNKILFDLVIKPKERIELKIHYKEVLTENKAEYIITTIKKWNRPVSEAVFTVQLSSDIESPRFSFEDNLVEKSYIEGTNDVIYKFILHDLYPDKEFQITWDK